jgi:GMP synthase (glutamine-hydrolysing)
MSPRVLVVQHEDEDPIHLMGTWMAGVDLTVCRAYDGDAVPASVDGYDGLVVMGGAMGASVTSSARSRWAARSR